MKMFSAAAAVAAVLLAASPGQAQQTLILGGSDTIGSLIDRMNLRFTELVNERAAGRLNIQFIQGEQLGNDMQVIEQMMGGGVHIYGDVLDWYANWVQDLSVLAWGFTFRDLDHLAAFLDSDVFAPYAEEMRTKHNVRILAAGPTQPRVLFAKKEIRTPDDLVGVKMRVPDIRAYMLLWQTLGTSPARVAWAEVYLGLRTGVIDATEGPVLSAFTANIHEAAPFVMKTEHVISSLHISMNEATFAALDPELQQILTEAAREAVQWARGQSLVEIEEVYGKMEAAGATVIEVDKAPFAEKALSGVATMEADGVWSPGLFARIQEIR